MRFEPRSVTKLNWKIFHSTHWIFLHIFPLKVEKGNILHIFKVWFGAKWFSIYTIYQITFSVKEGSQFSLPKCYLFFVAYNNSSTTRTENCLTICNFDPLRVLFVLKYFLYINVLTVGWPLDLYYLSLILQHHNVSPVHQLQHLASLPDLLLHPHSLPFWPSRYVERQRHPGEPRHIYIFLGKIGKYILNSSLLQENLDSIYLIFQELFFTLCSCHSGVSRKL